MWGANFTGNQLRPRMKKMLIGNQAKAVTTSHTVTTAFLSVSTGQWKCLSLPAAFYSSHTRSASVFFLDNSSALHVSLAKPAGAEWGAEVGELASQCVCAADWRDTHDLVQQSQQQCSPSTRMFRIPLHDTHTHKHTEHSQWFQTDTLSDPSHNAFTANRSGTPCTLGSAEPPLGKK